MLGKILERWVNSYYRKDIGSRSVMLIQREHNRMHVKVRGTVAKLKLNLYVAMIRDKDIRDVVLGTAELYRETEDDPMEYLKILSEQNKRRK